MPLIPSIRVHLHFSMANQALSTDGQCPPYNDNIEIQVFSKNRALESVEIHLPACFLVSGIKDPRCEFDLE